VAAGRCRASDFQERQLPGEGAKKQRRELSGRLQRQYEPSADGIAWLYGTSSSTDSFRVGPSSSSPVTAFPYVTEPRTEYPLDEALTEPGVSTPQSIAPQHHSPAGLR